MTDVSTPSGSPKPAGDDAPTPTAEEPPSLSQSTAASSQPSREGTPPPLPPRPRTAIPLSPRGDDGTRSSSGGLRIPSLAAAAGRPTRPALQSKATTALSLTEVQTHNNESRVGTREASPASRPSPAQGSLSRRVSSVALRLGRSRSGSEVDESGVSVYSYVPALEAGGNGDLESMLGEAAEDDGCGGSGGHDREESIFPPDPELEEAFAREFDDLDELEADGSNEDTVLAQWKSKLKHFLIISSAGKPIYSRHGSDTVISAYIGVLQTLISTYQAPPYASPLRSFTAGGVRFVVLSKGNLNLIAISRGLSEGEAQLRTQLESLYMQILSTLTLPGMDRIFAHRPSTDLRRPLQGTESLLSALADGFTRGSPSTLLSALECLKLRKSHRQIINNAFLKARCPSLLYGLMVASGRLVSVVRPKKHSLHPGDLHLIFNMLFEAGGVKAGGGENWIPLCLPGFNNTGFLYMYVSFLHLKSGGGGGGGDDDDDDDDDDEDPAPQNNNNNTPSHRPSTSSGQDELAIILISTDKESFFSLQQMRNQLVKTLQTTSSLTHIQTALSTPRPQCTDIAPGTPVQHFLYKSRGNVQYTMSSFSPHFSTALARRRLLSLYTELLNALHGGRGGDHGSSGPQLKVLQTTTTNAVVLGWATPLFELLCVAPAGTQRGALAAAANRVVEWVRREEERVFVIGGAVF